MSQIKMDKLSSPTAFICLPGFDELSTRSSSKRNELKDLRFHYTDGYKVIVSKPTAIHDTWIYNWAEDTTSIEFRGCISFRKKIVTFKRMTLLEAREHALSVLEKTEENWKNYLREESKRTMIWEDDDDL